MHVSPLNHSTNPRAKLIFALSLFTSAYWCVSQMVNVYTFALSGAMFELLWLPMIAGLFLLPLVALIFLIREGMVFRSFYFYSLIALTATGVLIYLLN